jgi:hypothetical protein
MKFQEIKQFVAENIQYKNWEFHVKEKNNVTFLQIQFEATDNFSGKLERQYCRKWQLSEWMTRTEIVRTAFLAVLQAERHESEEAFKYKGQAIFNSHLSADVLAGIAQFESNYEHRLPPVCQHQNGHSLVRAEQFHNVVRCHDCGEEFEITD